MVKIKIFTESSGEELESVVNSWLMRRPSHWSAILDMQYTQADGAWSVMVYYEK